MSQLAKAGQPLFLNHQHEKLARAGAAYILKKYFCAAKKAKPSLPQKISPHILRHSKAMHMLQAGVNLIYIRDFSGPVHIGTAEIYARADTEMKRRAIESAHIKINPDLPAWTDDKDLMALLTNLCGKDRAAKYYGKSLDLPSGSFLLFSEVLSILFFLFIIFLMESFP